VTTECPIYTGIFDGFSWIRCEGKGSFLNSPLLKAFGVERIAAGERCLVVDLEACTGMDSTFMGTLAGLATRLSAQDGGILQIADAGDRNRHSLEDLGLDFLIQIDPETAVWRGQVETIRTQLKSSNSAAPQDNLQKAIHVLEAHQVLSATNEKNQRSFSTVVTLLESEVQEKARSAGTPEAK
jgi:anti-anti-sigma regulatory factor